MAMKPTEKECKDVYDIVRGEAKAQTVDGNLNLVVGKYHLTGKNDTRGAFRFDIEII
jgi:hypothetical protein